MNPSVSVPVPTVDVMTAHDCTYFDEGDGVELLCVCGSRAVLVSTEDGDLLASVVEDRPALSMTA